MLDHLEVPSRDLKRSTDFYAAVLAPLGYRPTTQGELNGFGDGAGLDFFLVEGAVSAQVHFAFRAPNRELVRACWEAAKRFGAQGDGPALAPSVAPNYYYAYVTDPDGRTVEIVCREAE